MALLQTLSPLILVFHFVICLFLIVVILLQAGKGADMGATFGAGGSQSLFGARGAATFLSKMTTIAASLFLITSLSLAAIHRNQGGDSNLDKSVLDTLPPAPADMDQIKDEYKKVPAPATPPAADKKDGEKK